MANPLQTAGNDVPEKHIVWLCGQTLRALVLTGCAKHGGKEASAGWIADAVPVSERGVGIVYFLPGGGAKIEGSSNWKDWGGDSRSVVTSHRQGSARSCAGSELPGWPYPGFLEDSVWLQARRPAPETAIAAPTQGRDHLPQSCDPR